jgi:hypothetical protein
VRDAALEQLYQQIEPDEKAQLRTKISRLRRETKDSIIAKVVRLERIVGQQTSVENNLRDEVIRLRLISLQTTSS